MKGSYGRAFYGVQGLGTGHKGTEAAGYLRLGIVGNANVRTPTGVERLMSVGDRNPVELSEGMTSAEIGITIPAVEDPDFLQLAIHDVGTDELNWLSTKFGYNQGANQLTVVAIDCKIDTLTLRLEAGGRLNADVRMLGGKVQKSAADPGDMSFFGAMAYRWFEGIWDEVRDLRAIELTVRNNLTLEPLIAGSGTTRDPDRIWDAMDEGDTEVGGTLTYFLSDPAQDLQDCLIPGQDLNLTLQSCGDVSPGQLMVLHIHGLKPIDENLTLPAGGNILVEVPFMATGWDLVG